MTGNVLGFAQRGLFGIALAGAALSTQSAHAHINLDTEGTHMSRYGEADIKTGPCGRAGGARGTHIYTYKPGATIEISINEYVAHPGYFRIAFDNDGDDGFADPATVTGEHGNCAGDPKCGPGMEDFCNNDTVLLDNLDPHPSAGFGNTPSYTWTVTLPNVECENCTLQIIQVMTDLNFHAAPYPGDDIYYQCIDLVLSEDATDEGVAPAANDAMDCTADDPVAGAGGMTATGGSGGMGTGGMAAGGSGGMMATTGGVGGMMATTGGVGAAGDMSVVPGTGGAGAGGAAAMGGAAGMTAGAAGAGATGGAGGMTTAGTSASDDADSGCAVGQVGARGARSQSATSLLGLLTLALVFYRRKRD